MGNCKCFHTFKMKAANRRNKNGKKKNTIKNKYDGKSAGSKDCTDIV